MSTHREDISKLKKNVSIHFKIGLILSTLIVFLVINSGFIVYEKEELEIFYTDEPEIMMPITSHELPKKIPPPATIDVVEPLDIDVEVEIEPNPEPEPIVNPNPAPSNAISTTAPIAAAPSRGKEVKKEPTPPVVAPPEPEEIPEPIIFVTFAEQMPMFKLHPDENATKDEKKKYADAPKNYLILKCSALNV